MNTIKFMGTDIPIKISYKAAWFDLPDLGIDILDIFKDQSTMMAILTNDRVMIPVLYYFCDKHCSTLENAIENLTPSVMEEFREAFWNEVINFTSPQMRPALQETMKMLKTELASPEERLKRALSESLEEPE